MHTKLQTLMESEDALRYTPSVAAALNQLDIARILHSLHEPHHAGAPQQTAFHLSTALCKLRLPPGMPCYDCQ